MEDRQAFAVVQRTVRVKRLMNVSRWLFLCTLIGSFLAAGPTDDLIQRVESRYNGAKTLTVHFVERYSVVGHVRHPEEGVLTLRKQGKMRWDYSQPKGKLFVSDGKNVYLYTAADNRVEKVKVKDTDDLRAPLAFLLGRLDLKREFRNFAVRAGDGGQWLTASAKTDRLPYERIEMLIAADASIQQLRVVGADESLLDFRFQNERLNPPVNDSLFRFAIPAGAEVVDSVSLGTQEKEN